MGGAGLLGPALLFFGCRHPDQDFLYADELKGFAADGVSELHTAFSRGDGPKTYVQDLLAREKDEVWSLIEKGAVMLGIQLPRNASMSLFFIEA